MVMLFVIQDPDSPVETYAVLNDANRLSPISEDSFNMLSEMGFQVANDGEPYHPIAVIGACWVALGADVIGYEDAGTLSPSQDKVEALAKKLKEKKE